MQRLNIAQKTPEWHELRRNSLGASDAPVIMGISPYKTPLELWEEKLGLRQPSDATEHMNRGNDLEIVARDHYNVVFRDDMVPVVIQSDQFPFLIASLDGMNSMDDFIEIKYNRDDVHEEVSSCGTIPEHHMCQLQHQFLVTGKNDCHYVSINSRHQVIFIKVCRDNNYIFKLADALHQFWDMILKFDQPNFTDKDYVERRDQTWSELATELIRIKRELEPYEAMKKREEELRKTLIKECNGKSCVGAGLKITRFLKKGSLDIEKMCSELSLNSDKLEMWRKQSAENWRLGIL